MAVRRRARESKAEPVQLSLSRQDADAAQRILSQLVSQGREPGLDLLQLATVLRGSASELPHYFAADLFTNPALDILLTLYCAGRRNEPLSLSALGLSAGVPQSTVSRWLPTLIEKGLVERYRQEGDERRVFLKLTPPGEAQASLWLRHVGSQLALIWPSR